MSKICSQFTIVINISSKKSYNFFSSRNSTNFVLGQFMQCELRELADSMDADYPTDHHRWFFGDSTVNSAKVIVNSLDLFHSGRHAAASVNFTDFLRGIFTAKMIHWSFYLLANDDG